MRKWCLLALGWPACLLAQNLPVLKARVGEPVVQELMGGCSLRCAFGWETLAAAPGEKARSVDSLDDNDAATAWTEAPPGTRVEFRFPRKLPPELNGTPFYGFDVANGVVKPLAQFKDHARVKKCVSSTMENPSTMCNSQTPGAGSVWRSTTS